jgi:FKBP-type peptidyl-prolyl cis-trans isomerase FklB
MKLISKQIAILILLACFIPSCKKSVEISRIPDDMKEKRINELTINTAMDSVSYALGLVWGENIKKGGYSVLSNTLYFGVYDFIHNKDTIFSLEQARKYLSNHDSIMKIYQNDLSLDINSKLGEINLATPFDTFSYVCGYVWIGNVIALGIEDIGPTLLTGLNARMNGDSTIFDYASADNYLRKNVIKKRTVIYSDTRKKNADWFEQNANNPDVIEHPSGIQYKVLRKGNGKKPSTDNIFVCYYTIKLIDGTIVDSEYKTGEPFKFYLSAVTPGWANAMVSMNVGDHWEVYIPYTLAYGPGGMGDMVPPYSTVIMDIDFLDALDSKEYHKDYSKNIN